MGFVIFKSCNSLITNKTWFGKSKGKEGKNNKKHFLPSSWFYLKYIKFNCKCYPPNLGQYLSPSIITQFFFTSCNYRPPLLQLLLYIHIHMHIHIHNSKADFRNLYLGTVQCEDKVVPFTNALIKIWQPLLDKFSSKGTL